MIRRFTSRIETLKGLYTVTPYDAKLQRARDAPLDACQVWPLRLQRTKESEVER